MDGTIKMCEDLAVDPEDVVLLAVAYELKSPRMGVWNRKGWVDGWKRIGYVSNYFRPIATFPSTELRSIVLSSPFHEPLMPI